MYVRCEKCGRNYDDAKCWTICPHGPLWAGLSDYCPRCDTVKSLHGPCPHQQRKEHAMAMTREIARDKIPAHLHAAADALHATGKFNWQQIWAVLTEIMPLIGKLFNDPTPQPAAKAFAQACPDELEAQADELVQKAGEAFCAACCMRHALTCDE